MFIVKNTEQGLGAWPANPLWFDKLIPEHSQLGDTIAPQKQSAQQGSSRSAGP